METQLIHSFRKNDREEIRISFREYKERFYIDMRLYFLAEDRGEMCPSKKGLTLGIDFLPEIKLGITKLEDVARQVARGPVPESS